jgi:hypothetical protein
MREDGNGYRKTPLAERSYRVELHFRGLAQDFRHSEPNNRQLTLLRAAELALEDGYRHFIVDPVALPGTSPDGDRSLVVKLFHAPPAAAPVVYDACHIASELYARHPFLVRPGSGQVERLAEACDG